mmetsp:Transcript_9018/g.14357  ORF Transcript_9018/g.14357 Transcript_9018/m.14357 type:complete len:306 (+) Transcript_9018:31-948(+)
MATTERKASADEESMIECNTPCYKGWCPLPAFINVFRDEIKRRDVVDPTEYLRAQLELAVLSMILCGIVTRIFNPEMLKDNHIKSAMGYNSGCVNFDERPAIYLAVPLYGFGFYCLVRYAILDSTRSIMFKLDPARKMISMVGNVIYALSAGVFLLVFVDLPYTHEHSLNHYLFFAQFIATRMVVAWTDFYKGTAMVEVSVYSWIFLAEFTAMSIAGLVIPSINFVSYESDPDSHKPIQPTELMMVLDYWYVINVYLLTIFLPKCPALHITRELIRNSGLEDVKAEGKKGNGVELGSTSRASWFP